MPNPDLSCWPQALIKATQDDFQYAIGLKCGAILKFSSVAPDASGRWVHLHEVEVLSPSPALRQLDFDRGIEVALNWIGWVVDCPGGT